VDYGSHIRSSPYDVNPDRELTRAHKLHSHSLATMQGVLRLFLSLVLGCAVLAYDLDVRKRPKGELGVAIDISLALKWPEVPKGQSPNKPQSPRNWLLSSHITFNEEVSTITDGQLWKIAIDAYNEMVPELQQYDVGLGKNLPGAMGLIAFGKELIIASSQKGPKMYIYQLLDDDSPVKEDLALCQTVWVEAGLKSKKGIHRRDGKCSEVMAAQLYHVHHGDSLSRHGARVVTMTIVDNKSGEIGPAPPCGDKNVGIKDQPVDWGCNLFVAAQNLKPVPTDTPPQGYELNDLAGGVAKKGQIQLCGGWVESRPPTPTPTASVEEGQM
jgi:hypothetical protein